MASHLAIKFKQRISELVLLPSDGGRFEVKVGEELIYSKLSTGQFPDNASIETAVEQHA